MGIKRGSLFGFVVGAAVASACWAFYPRVRYEVSKLIPEQKTFVKAPFTVSGDPALGVSSAPVTIVEFSDFECPYCKMFHDEILPKLRSEYIDRGLVRFVHKDLPLPFHANAAVASELARCSALDGNYWKSYEALFKSQDCITCKGSDGILADAKLKTPAVQDCLNAKQQQKAVSSNLVLAKSLSINGTPTFVIGLTSGNQHKGEVISGVVPWDAFKARIDQELKLTR